MNVVQFVDEGLGNAAHLLVSEAKGVAALVDPLRDVDRYLDAARDLGVEVTHVFETHLHNDFISGGRELTAKGARLCAGATAELGFDHLPLGDGEAVLVGDLTVVALATPGHTPEHLAYLVSDGRHPAGPQALFSGGSLLVGGVARTDLLGAERAPELARLLYHSLREKIAPLVDTVQVYPTHGGGSFCIAAPDGARATTLGAERLTNPFLRATGPDEFVQLALHGLGSYPAYFTEMRPINQRGPRILGDLPALVPLTPRQVQARLEGGEALLDIRPALEYAGAHVPGAYHSEYREGFATWVGWVVPFGTPLVLLAADTAALAGAVRRLIRIGYDALPGYLDGGIEAWRAAGLPVARFPVVTVAGLRDQLEGGRSPTILDVRQDAEWEAGHIPGAYHAEAGSLPAGALTLPKETPLAVHCGHAPRAATALSVLERLGYTDLRLVEGGYGAWERAGFPVERSGSGR